MRQWHKVFRELCIILVGLSANVTIVSSVDSASPMASDGRAGRIQSTSPECNEFVFDATHSKLPANANTSFYWDFGDGTTSREPVISHTYQQSGDYTVKLAITDNSRSKCSAAESFQTVRANIPPVPSFVSENRACVYQPMTFDASTSRNSNDLWYSWNFGDGTIVSGDKLVSKFYTKGGRYNVLLSVDDLKGSSCSKQTSEKSVHINEPPKAEAGNELILKCVESPDDMIVSFDASATTDTNADLLTYLWDFGDGHTATGVKVSHRFKKMGSYDVRLMVDDNTKLGCSIGFDFITVRFNRPPKADAGSDVSVCTQEDVNFDGSNSEIHKKGTVIAQWFFGDGASGEGLRTSHRFAHPGVYQSVLILETKLNTACPIARDARIVAVNAPPSVAIKAVNNECVGQEVFFDASSAFDRDGDDLLFYWTFGDGTAIQGPAKTSHVYQHGGIFRVSVIADDGKGTSCSTATATVNLRINTAPIADVRADLPCCVGQKASFTAATSSDPDADNLTYIWDFGDGTGAHGKSVIHSFSRSGTFNVQLTVDDQTSSACSRSVDSITVDVRQAPVPIIEIR